MKAARLHEYGKPLVIEEVPTPRPGPGQVLVKVGGAGFCHSDLHVLSGEIQILPVLPITLGHENAGVVAEVGDGVRAVSVGDQVAVYGGWGCGYCPWCARGDEHLCATPEWVGLSRHHGGYAEYLLVARERYLVRLDRLDPKMAAPLTDAALTPYRAVKKALPLLTPDVPALVIGVGGLGQYGVKLLERLCASPIVAVDLDRAKLAKAKTYGASHLLEAADAELQRKLLDLSGGLGVGVAFDFVGSDATLALALGATRSGGKVIQIGLAGGTARIKALETRFEVGFEVSLWGSLQELREVIAMAERGELTSIEQETAPLDQINEVARRLRAGEVQGRVVITP